jgi:hypothetical protein
MILTTIYSIYISVWTDHPASVSWSGRNRASSRRSNYFNVCESWEGRFLYVDDDIVGPAKQPWS